MLRLGEVGVVGEGDGLCSRSDATLSRLLDLDGVVLRDDEGEEPCKEMVLSKSPTVVNKDVAGDASATDIGEEAIDAG